MTQPKIVADYNSQLATAIAVGGTSFTLSSATDDDGVALPAGLYYFTVDNTTAAKEYLAGTLSGTSVTGVVSVSRQGVETSGAVRAHRVGAGVLLTDFATYKKYIDDVAIAGTVDSSTTVKGVVETATQAEVDAGTATGATGANLVATPALIRAKAYHDYAADAGGTDAYAITITPAITAYATGQIFTFKANTANTGAATLNVSGIGAKTIVRSDGSSALVTGDIIAGEIVQVIYDGTNLRMFKTIGLGLTDVQTFNANGTWTKPSTGQTMAYVQAWGGGGGGAADGGGSNTGGGGGGGGYSERTIPLSSLGATETVTVPAAATAGNTGGTVTFGSWITAYGGGGGISASGSSGGSQGNGGTGAGPLGAGATGSNSSVAAAGAPGAPLGGAVNSDALYGGGGGGGRGYYGGGGGAGSVTGGVGGSSVFGGAGGNTGTNGTAPGGGGGAQNDNGTGSAGLGAAGRVIITCY